MKKYLFLIIIYCISSFQSNAQNGGIGINTTELHKNAILSIQNSKNAEDDVKNSKGVKFPHVATMKDLQRYDAATSNPDKKIYNYTADPSIEGMITYVDDPGDFFVFDGVKWSTLFSKGRFGSSAFETAQGENKSFAFVIGFSGKATPNFRIVKRDDLGIAIKSEQVCDTIVANNGNEIDCHNISTFSIPEDGMYDITLALSLDAKALISLSFDAISLEISGWVNGSQAYSHYFPIGGFIQIGKEATVNTSFSMFLRSGDRLRFSLGFPWTGEGGIIKPSGFINLNGGKDTYIIIRKIF